jgi:hypothetical protein
MEIILTGIEYSGTSTMAEAIREWYGETTGSSDFGFHDHFKVPHVVHQALTDEEQRLVLALSPRLKEAVQRHQMEYHVQPTFFKDGNHSVTGLHIEDAVYGPLYWDYGGAGDEWDRSVVSRQIEARILEYGSKPVLALLTASADVIARRMKENPHESSPLQEKDIDHVLKRFQEEYDKSRIPNKFTLDTSSATVEETVAEFAEKIEPFLEDSDRLRMQLHETAGKGS